MALIGIVILLIVLIPVIVAGAMLAAALWTIGRLLFERDWSRESAAPAREPVDAGELRTTSAPARALP
jgi:hypothetical protein